MFIQNSDGSLMITGANYFYFFAGLMFVTAFLFAIFARHYKTISYYQVEKT